MFVSRTITFVFVLFDFQREKGAGPILNNISRNTERVTQKDERKR